MLQTQVILKSAKSLLINIQTIKRYIMIIQTFILFLAMLSCQEQKPKNKTTTKSKISKVVVAKRPLSHFAGNFSGTHNNKEIFVTLKAVPRTSKISGILTMEGKEATIAATETSATNCNGIITENDTKKRYNITAAIVNKKLHFNITFPEYNNQILALVLERSNLVTNQGGNTIAIDSGGGTTTSSGSSGTSTKKNNRDRALVGKWRFTEVISSESGQFYSSFSTDYFLQFNANGECRTWTGSSAGGSGNVSYDGAGNTNLEIAQWYTFGKNVVFVNSNTNKELSIPYFAEENRMMLKGSLNRVYQRIY